MKKIGFIGLGVMGYPMAGHLQKNGYEVTVYNRTLSKAQNWVAEHGGICAETPREAAKGAQFVMTCVGNDEDLRAVCLGADGAFAGMKPDAVFVDHTSVSASVSCELSRLAAVEKLSYLDAPVSGGQAGAEKGQLTVMCGGDVPAFDQAKTVIAAYAKKCTHLGPVGAGQTCKMCNQIAIAGVLQGLAEALNFANKAGLDARQVVEVISQGAAGSWQMDNRHKTMLKDEYDHGFAVDWMRKDLGIALRAGDDIEASLPLTALVDQFYKDIQRMGGGRWDTSSLLKRLQ